MSSGRKVGEREEKGFVRGSRKNKRERRGERNEKGGGLEREQHEC